MAVADNSALGHNGGLDELLNGKDPQGSDGGRSGLWPRGSYGPRSVWFVIEQLEFLERGFVPFGRGICRIP
jgi:hypothetical protein